MTRAHALAVLIVLAALGCDRAPEPPRMGTAERRSPMSDASASLACADVVGAWSAPVDGLRARIVTSGSTPDRRSLDIFLDVENVSLEPIELHWTGHVPLGFVTFNLDDVAGNDAEPDWRFGGNSPGGNVRALFPTGEVIRYRVHTGAFAKMMGKRALRIGAFWGRELPTDGSKRFLRAVITAGATNPDGATYLGERLVATPPSARVWSGSLRPPAVCID